MSQPYKTIQLPKGSFVQPELACEDDGVTASAEAIFAQISAE